MRAPSTLGVAMAVLMSGSVEAACHSTCTEELRACRTACANVGSGDRRACRQWCTEQSTCSAPGNRLRLGALVVDECTTDAAGLTTFKQKLLARRGNCDPVTIMELPPVGPLPDPLIAVGGVCGVYGDFRTGGGSVAVGLFQRIAVLPDASAVVFELTNHNSLVPSLSPAPPEDGTFIVRPDGSGLRRLGPPIAVPILAAVVDPTSPIGFSFVTVSGTAFSVSPNGRLIVFMDDVSSPADEDTRQVVVQDLPSGARRQVTRLPRAPAGSPAKVLPVVRR